jgi:hypothetical protein
MCLDAYREALTRDMERRANPAKGELERSGAGSAGTTAGSGPAITLGSGATALDGESENHR